MITTIVFDFDGVLVESGDIKTIAFGKLFEDEGKAVSEAVVDYHLRHEGLSRFIKIRHIHEHILRRPLTEERFTSLCDTFARLVADEVAGAPFVPGAKEFLDEWSGTYACHIASATPEDELRMIVERRGMAGYFRSIHGAPKSKGDILADILATTGTGRDEAVFVGDAMSDCKAAASCSVRFIARVVSGKNVFDGVECDKLPDLTGLRPLLESL